MLTYQNSAHVFVLRHVEGTLHAHFVYKLRRRAGFQQHFHRLCFAVTIPKKIPDVKILKRLHKPKSVYSKQAESAKCKMQNAKKVYLYMAVESSAPQRRSACVTRTVWIRANL